MEGYSTESSQLASAGVQKPLLWFDPNVGNSENAGYQQELQQAGFALKTFTTIGEASTFLKTASDNGEKWLVMSNGGKGEDFATAVHAEPSVASIIVFTSETRVGICKGWAKNFPKIQNVTAVTEDMRTLVRSLGNALASAAIAFGIGNQALIQAAVPSSFPGLNFETGKVEFYCVEKGRSITFLLVLCGMAHGPITEDMLMDELHTLVTKDKWTKFKQDWKGPWQRNQPNKAITPTCLGHRLSLAYTSDYLYDALKFKLAQPEGLAGVRKFVGSFVQECMRSSSKQHQGDELLYRGVKMRCLKGDADHAVGQNGSHYAVGQRFTWPTFASTSKERGVAFGSFSDEGGAVFVITRCALADRHPTIDIDKNPDWGHYGGGEQEALWMPYPEFQVTKSEPPNSSTMNRHIIHVQEMPTRYKLLKDRSKLGQMVREWLGAHVLPQIEAKMHHVVQVTQLDCGLNREFLSNYFHRTEKESPPPHGGHPFSEDFDRVYDRTVEGLPPPDALKAFFDATVGSVAGTYAKQFNKKVVDDVIKDLPGCIMRQVKLALHKGVHQVQTTMMHMVQMSFQQQYALPQVDIQSLVDQIKNRLANNERFQQMITQAMEQTSLFQDLQQGFSASMLESILALLFSMFRTKDWRGEIKSDFRAALTKDLLAEWNSRIVQQCEDVLTKIGQEMLAVVKASLEDIILSAEVTSIPSCLQK